MIVNTARLSQILTLLIILTCCGGGGGGGNGGGSEPDPDAQLQPPSIADISAQIYTANSAISTLSFNNSGGMALTGCVADSLPTGLSIAVSSDSRTCEITGAPSVFHLTNAHTITATNAAGSDSATVTITVDFVFTPQTNIAPNTSVISNSITSSGIDDSANISISGGEYSLDGGDFTSAAGSISNGQSVRVRVISSSTPETTTSATLIVGALSDTFSVTTLENDAVAPQASIVFPPLVSVSHENNIIIRGTSSDDKGVSGVQVNGIDVTSDDGFATWTATVPLNLGQNTLSARVTDTFGNTFTSVPIRVDRYSVSFSLDDDIIFDGITDQLLWLNHLDSTLYGIGSDVSRSLTALSSPSIPNNNNIFSSPGAITLDAENNQVYVMDVTATDAGLVDRILRVNLLSGERTVLSEDTLPIAEHHMRLPNRIQVDTVNGYAYVHDSSGFLALNDRLIRFNLDTAEATLISEEAGFVVQNFALDLANNRALFVETFPAADLGVTAINLTTGERTSFSSNSVPDNVNPFQSPGIITLDSANNRALVYDSDDLIAVSLSDGSRTIVASDVNVPEFIRSGTSWSADMALDSENSRVLIVLGDSAMYEIDLTTGVGGVFSNSTTPDGTNPFVRATGIALDSTNNRALVIGSTGVNSVMAVDLDTGARTVVTDSGAIRLRSARGIAVDPVRNRAIIVDNELDAVVAVSFADGSRSIFSDNSVPDENNTFMTPKEVSLDTTHNRLLITDDERVSLIGVDLDTGNRSVVSNRQVPGDNSLFTTGIGALTIDSGGSRALVLDAEEDRIISVDVGTGANSIFSGQLREPSNSGLYSQPRDLVLDSNGERLLMLDYRVVSNTYMNQIESFNLTTGARSLLPETGIELRNSSNFALNSEQNQILLSDSALQRIISQNLITGERNSFFGGVPNNNAPMLISSTVSPVLDLERARVLVLSDTGTGPAIVAVDMNSGVRSLVSSNQTPNTLIPFGDPADIDLDTDSSRILLVDAGLNALLAVDINTGARSIISDASTPDEFNPFSRPEAVVFDSGNSRALVLDTELNAIISVNLTPGSNFGVRTVLSDSSTPDSVNAFSAPTSLVVDSANNRALVTDSELEAVIAVDLTNGARTVVSDNSTADSFDRFSTRDDVTLDTLNNRLLMITRTSRNGIYAVDLESGALTRISLTDEGDLSGIVLAADPSQAFITDLDFGLLKIDLQTGQVVTFSR